MGLDSSTNLFKISHSTDDVETNVILSLSATETISENIFTIDNTSTAALTVRQNSSGNISLQVDTTNERVQIPSNATLRYSPSPTSGHFMQASNSSGDCAWSDIVIPGDISGTATVNGPSATTFTASYTIRRTNGVNESVVLQFDAILREPLHSDMGSPAVSISLPVMLTVDRPAVEVNLIMAIRISSTWSASILTIGTNGIPIIYFDIPKTATIADALTFEMPSCSVAYQTTSVA